MIMINLKSAILFLLCCLMNRYHQACVQLPNEKNILFSSIKNSCSEALKGNVFTKDKNIKLINELKKVSNIETYTFYKVKYSGASTLSDISMSKGFDSEKISQYCCVHNEDSEIEKSTVDNVFNQKSDLDFLKKYNTNAVYLGKKRIPEIGLEEENFEFPDEGIRYLPTAKKKKNIEQNQLEKNLNSDNSFEFPYEGKRYLPTAKKIIKEQRQLKNSEGTIKLLI